MALTEEGEKQIWNYYLKKEEDKVKKQEDNLDVNPDLSSKRNWRIQPRLSYVSKTTEAFAGNFQTQDPLSDGQQINMGYFTPEIVAILDISENFSLDAHFIYHHKKKWAFEGQYFKENGTFKIQTHNFEAIFAAALLFGNSDIKGVVKPGLGVSFAEVIPSYNNRTLGSDNPHVVPVMSFEAGILIFNRLNFFLRGQTNLASIQIYNEKNMMEFDSSSIISGAGINL